MKANAIGLEVVIELYRKEFSDLKGLALNGEMRFRGIGENAEMDEQIPIKLNHFPEGDFCSMSMRPTDVYFGEARKITFSINDLFYQEVIKHRSYGGRFSIGGKLRIRIV